MPITYGSVCSDLGRALAGRARRLLSVYQPAIFS